MDEMISYIFDKLHNSEGALKMIGKSVQKQKSVNRNVTICTIVMGVLIAKGIKDAHRIHKEIDILKENIKELENQKGD